MASLAKNILQFRSKITGKLNTPDFRVYCYKNNKPISFFHDVPLTSDKDTFNMVTEIPRWTQAKCEISLTSPFHPIKQDLKNGKLRYVANSFPYHGFIWNYGALPQTWEDPNVIDSRTKMKGDGDPLDVCEIGGSIGYIGQIKQVKVLGALGLIDQGETDWKILAIDINDPRAKLLNDISDVQNLMPRLLPCTRDWFAIYKIPDGKPKNRFFFDGNYLPKSDALDIIAQCHQHWKVSRDRKQYIKNFHNESVNNVDLINKINSLKEEVSQNVSNYPSFPYFHTIPNL
ncbi:putative inorganic pyrophosphatase C3A12.02 [Schizosaccharomyces pombe]|uniref:Putative inorganic pyrophosphatase C3A12.02 n=1 Tax=Schizosaccharomyces pombe (strain 972 / ATCC 24843) TaxID=284812 RepID=IPYR2_SCHPO|nr:putative inorganic diphosphatase [Schizosaccharomyces pombe]P87118.1 RecName: Full=Putative inorganic pyrophosphatase C3A12.02; AltName: Full=Pyrophosphate phosphohydrolase; Short=PPase [Schizosaccharomyces pombe 972h-]CAB08747.1 mitochondrial inorganic diphosphatase (predicted) [Schizosaccharomyces pombe]|eukprot:NP_593328.1 putative inorganic diphosphatase [Schizosaccharomyces pombe]